MDEQTRGTCVAAHAAAQTPLVGDGAVARRIGPIMLAAALGLIPFTVFSTFLVDIAADAGREPVALGSLRGLGGIAAVLVGVLYVPLADRVSPRTASAGALALLGLGSGLLLVSERWAVIGFCLAIGAATAVLNPALQAAAAKRFTAAAEQGRAATMVTATTTLTAVLAGPVLGGLSLLGGWRVPLTLTAVLALVTALCVLRRPADGGARVVAALRDPFHEPDATPAGATREPAARRTSWQALLRRRDLLALVGVSAFRTAAFMGALAVVAAVYAERHGIAGTAFTLVWTVSGASFFAANWWSGRGLSRRGRAGAVATAGIVAALAGVVLVFTAIPLPLMVAGTALLAAGHAMVAASVTTLLVRRAGDLRGRALAMAGTGQSVGTFAGAWLAGAAFAAGGWAGCAAALAGLTVIAGALLVPALREGSILSGSRGASPSGRCDPR